MGVGLVGVRTDVGVCFLGLGACIDVGVQKVLQIYFLVVFYTYFYSRQHFLLLRTFLISCQI